MEDNVKCKKCSDVYSLILRDRHIYNKNEIIVLIDYFCNLNVDSYCCCIFESRHKLTKVNSVFQALIDQMLNSLKMFAQKKPPEKSESENNQLKTSICWNLVEIIKLIECVTKIYSMTFILNVPSKQIGTVSASEISSDILLSLQTYCIIPKTIPVLLLQNICYFCDFRGFSVLKIIFNLEPSPPVTSLLCAIIKMLVLIVDWLDPRFLPNDYSMMRAALLQHVLKMDSSILSKPLKGERLLISANPNRNSIPNKSIGSQSQISFHDVTKYNFLDLVWLCCKIEFINQWSNYEREVLLTFSSEIILEPFIDMITFILKLLRYDNTSVRISAVTNLLNLIQQCMDLDNQLIWMGYTACFSMHLSRYILDQKILALIFSPEQHPEVTRIAEPMLKYFNFIENRALQNLASIARAYRIIGGNSDSNMEGDNKQYILPPENSCKSMIGVEYFKHIIIQCGVHAMVAFNMEILNKLPSEEITDETLYVSQFLCKQMWLFHLKSELVLQKRKQMDSTSSTDHKDSPMMQETSGPLIMSQDEYCSEYTTHYDTVRESGRPASSEASWGSKKNVSIDDETFSDALLNSPSFSQSDLMLQLHDIPVDDEFRNLVDNKMSICQNQKEFNESTSYFREFDSDIDTEDVGYRNKFNSLKFPSINFDSNSMFEEKVNRKRKHECNKNCSICKTDSNSKIIKKSDRQNELKIVKQIKSQEAEDLISRTKQTKFLRRSNSVPIISNNNDNSNNIPVNFRKAIKVFNENDVVNRNFTNTEFLQHINEYNPSLFQIVVQICDANANSASTPQNADLIQPGTSQREVTFLNNPDSNIDVFDCKYIKQKVPLFTDKRHIANNIKNARTQKKTHNLRLLQSFLRENNFANVCNNMFSNICCAASGVEHTCEQNNIMSRIQQNEDDLNLDDDCRSTSRSSSSTEDEEIIANRLLDASFYECLAKPGYTLLWDVLSEKRYSCLSSSCRLLAPRLFLQMLESFNEDNIRLLFLKGCVENITVGHSKTISLKLIGPIIRLLSSCRESRSTFRQFFKTNNVIQILLKELVSYKVLMIEKLKSLENEASSDRTHSEVLDDIVLRLEVLGLVFTEINDDRNSNDDSSVETNFICNNEDELNDMADIIWQALIKDMPTFITDITFSWWLSLFKETINIFSSENIKHIIEDLFPTIPPSKLTIMALELYQCLIRKERNLMFRLKQNMDNDFIWQAAVYAENADVSVMAIKINAMISLEYLKENVERYCLENLNSEISNIVKQEFGLIDNNANLTRITTYLSKCILSLKNGIDMINRICHQPLKGPQHIVDVVPTTVDNILITIQRVLNILHSLLLEFTKHFAFSITTKIIEIGEEPNYAMCFIDSKWNWIKPLYPKSQELSISLILNDKKILLLHYSHHIFGVIRAEAVYIYKNHCNSVSPNTTVESQFCGIVRLFVEGVEIKPENDYKCLQELNINDGCSIIVCKCETNTTHHLEFIKAELFSSSKDCLYQIPDCYLPQITESPFNIYKILTQPEFFNTFYQEIFYNLMKLLHTEGTGNGFSTSTKYRLWLLTRNMLEIIYLLSKWIGNEHQFIRSLPLIQSENDIKRLYDLTTPHSLIINLRLTQNICQGLCRNISCQNFMMILQQNNGLMVFINIVKSINEQFQNTSQELNFWLLDILGCLLDILFYFTKSDSNFSWKSILQNGDFPLVLFNISVSLARISRPVPTNKHQLKSETEIDCLKLTIRLMSSILPSSNISIINNSSVMSDWIRMLVIDCPIKQLRLDVVSFLSNICERDTVMSLIIFKSAITNLTIASEKCNLIAICKVDMDLQKNKYFVIKDDSCEHNYFDLLRIIIDFFPNNHESYDTTLLAIDLVVNIIDKRTIYEKRPLKFEDVTLIGLIKVLRRLTSSLISSQHRNPSCITVLNDVVIKVFRWMFNISNNKSGSSSSTPLVMSMKFLDLQTNTLPKFKGQLLRRLVFELLLDFCQISTEIFQTLCSKIVDIHIERSLHDDFKIFALEYWPRDDLREETGFCGIINLGATCYLATTIQHLFMIPECRKLILECTESNLKWFNKLQSIFSFLQFSERSGLNPKAFCDVYEMNKQVINTGEQKDMSEFFSDLIGKLETVSLTLKNGIKNLFGGESSSYIVSLDCPHQSRIPEEFYFLSLNVNNMTSLQQSFAHFVEKDILDGNNKYRCSDCDCLVRAEKRMCLTKLPSILCLNIMRYYFDVNTLRREKLNNFFEFPMQLDVEPFMKHSLMALEPDAGVAGNCKYRLIGITVHSGTSESGHYYSFIKDRSDGKVLFWNDQNSSSDKWFCFNDSKIKCFDPTNIPSECFGGLNVNKRNIETSQLFLGTSEYKTNNAYMLFYERVSVGDNRKESKSMEIVIPPNIYSAIEMENQRFLHDCLLFDLNYFQFLLQFGTNVPRLISKPHTEMLVTTDVGKVCASFILEVLLHSREKPELSQWVELLFRIISSCRPSQLWLIDFMTTKSKWITQYLFLCSDKIVRNLFIRFVQELAKLLLNQNDANTNVEFISKKMKLLIKSMFDSLSLTTSDLNNITSINMKLNQFDEPIMSGMSRPTLVQCGPNNATCSRFNSSSYHDQLENYFDLFYSLVKLNPDIMLPLLFKYGGIHNLITFYLNIRLCDSEIKVCSKQTRGHKYLEMKSLLQSTMTDAKQILIIDNKQISNLIMQSVVQSQNEIGANSRNKSYLENLIVVIVEILSYLSHKSLAQDNSSLSKEDAVALLSEDFINSNFSLSTDPCQSMPFLYHQICDTINPSYTMKLLALLISYRKEILPPLICFLMLSATVQADPIRCQNFLYYLNVLLQMEEKCKISNNSMENEEDITRPIEHLVLSRSMDFALLSRCSYQWLNWMSTRCADTEFLNCLLMKLDDWLYKFLVLDPNNRVRQNSRDLIKALLRSSQESDSDSSDECAQETDIQQKLFNKLLSLLNEIREKRCSVTKSLNNEWINTSGPEIQSNEPWRQEDHLTAYFNALKDCMYSQSDRLKVNEYLPDIWAIYHPGMSVALCPINWEKQALLAFLYRVCLNNNAAVDFLTKTSSVSMPISTNYILSDLEDPTVVNYNRKMLPHFFGVLTVCCQRSAVFRLNLCHKCDTIDWCYRHILPHRQYYGSVIDDIISLTQAMIEPIGQTNLTIKDDTLASQSKFRRKFLRKHISTELRSKLLLKLCSMLIQDNEDRLTLAMHDGFYALCLAALDLVNKYCSTSTPESEKFVIEILSIITQIIRYCLLVIEQSTGTSLRRDIFYRTQGRFKSQMLELATKCLHLICSESPRQMRLSSIEFVRQVLDVYQKDFLTMITKELLSYQNKLNIENIVNRDTSVFLRLMNHNSSVKSSHVSKKDSDTHKVTDDKVMPSYFSLVDRVSRMAVNLHRFNSDTMTLCLTAAIQSYPIACPLFAQFCLEILHSDLIAEVEHMMTSSLFHDYISLIISGDVSHVLREKAIIQLLEEVFPKIANSLFSRSESEQITFKIIETVGARLLQFKPGDVTFDLSGIDHLLSVLYIFLRYPPLEPILKKISSALMSKSSSSELSLSVISNLDFLFGNNALNIKQILHKSSLNKESTSEDIIDVQSPSNLISTSESVKFSENCMRLKGLLDKIIHLVNTVNKY